MEKLKFFISTNFCPKGWMGPNPPAYWETVLSFPLQNGLRVRSSGARSSPTLGAPGGFMRSPFCFEESWICRIRAVLLFNIIKKGAPDPALT